MSRFRSNSYDDEASVDSRSLGTGGRPIPNDQYARAREASFNVPQSYVSIHGGDTKT